MGKSRLAREFAARHLAEFAGGTYWVSLAPLTRSQEIPAALAESLGFPFGGELSPEIQVAQRLSQLGSCLIILDNYEHLLESASLLQGWMNQAAGLKVLVTSRRALKLRQESVVMLSPLQPHEAARLFEECCRSHGSTQPLSIELVQRIVTATQAMPLALELAAGQLATLTLTELAEELEQSLELLDSGYVDRDQRERGLQCVFQSSWERLSPLLQAKLAELSHFRGGFSKQAAAQVVGAGLPSLVHLIEHSLLRRLPCGRFEVHEQIRQLAIRKLPEGSDVGERHATYVASWMNRLQARIRSLSQPLQQTLHQIEEEQANLRVAWKWIADHDRWSLWQGSWYGWLTFFDLTGRNQEFEQDFLQPALQQCRSIPDRGGWLLARAINLNRLGQGPEGLALFEEALAALDQPETQPDRAYGLVQWALITQNRDPSGVQAEGWVQSALPALQQSQFVTGLSLAYTALAVACWTQRRDRPGSQQWLHQALEQVQGNPHPTGRLNLHWAHLALSQGDLESARAHAQRGLDLAGSVHDHFYHAYAQVLLGQADVLAGLPERAEPLLLSALDESWKFQLLSITQQALLGLAGLRLSQGQTAQAGQILGAVEPKRLPWSAREWFEELHRKAPAQTGPPLARLIQGLLAELGPRL
jgi:predicted ATPase